MHVMLITFLIIAAVVATGFLFVFWLIVTLLRGAGRLLFGPPPGRQAPRPFLQHQPGPVPMPMQACERVSCRALNPLDARFCRRCGQKLHMPQQVPVRRAAML
ncbi:MAG TPA: zinc ribbon domain-containing protein [Tepidisphaeraceae bacterium]